MLGLTWWGWAGLGVLAILALLTAARRSWRTGVRRELVEYLGQAVPEIAIVAAHPDRLDLRLEAHGDGGTFYLDRFYSQMTATPTGDGPDARAAREQVYRVVAASLREATAAPAVTAEQDRPRLRPRLVDDATLGRLRQAVEASGTRLPALPSGVAGLSIVLVLDSEMTVAYVTDTQLAALALTADEALIVARANLAATFSRDVVRSAVGSRHVNVIKTCDTFDAARLLLVPGYLETGETLVALIPDRDTLVLTTPPANGDWAGLRTLAGTADGDALYPEPLVVTSAGIARAA